VEIEKEGALESEPHTEGTEEYITVFEGQLNIVVNGEEFHLLPGDSIKFKADRSHIYRNEGDSIVQLSMVIYYPE
jgi:uncharacterized cupin superfamily protein